MPTPRARDTRLLSLDPPQHQEVLQLALQQRYQCKGEGRGQTRTNGPTKAVMFGPQLDFQASQGTEWVFGVSFLLIQLNSTFYCGFPDPRYLISTSCCVLQTNSADLVLRQDTSALLPTPETQPKKQANKKSQVILHLFQNRYEFKATESPHKVSEKSKKIQVSIADASYPM